MNALQKVLKDPFSHFILIGTLLFFLYGWLSIDEKGADNRIVISEYEVETIVNNWQQRWNTPPTEAELAGMIEQKIREEILYREAMSLNLDQDDVVIRRRLADKMSYIINDVLVPEQATDQQLQLFMDSHPDKFISPVRFTFSHYYFDDNLQNTIKIADRVVAAQIAIRNGEKVLDDDFPGKKYIEDLPEHQIARLFGRNFAEQLEPLILNEWSDPLKSGYGLHLVNVVKRTKATTAELSDIRSRVLKEWQVNQQKKSNINAYQSLRAAYDIKIEMPLISSQSDQ